MIQDLRKQKCESDEQIALLNHQLTLVSMEKEKYIAILSARDRQIKEIRSEMSQLQEVVNEQLVELQNAPCSSIPSSISNMTSKTVIVKNFNYEHNFFSFLLKFYLVDERFDFRNEIIVINIFATQILPHSHLYHLHTR